MHIVAYKPPCLKDGIDQVYWKYSKNGNFTVSSAYSLLTNFNHKCEEKWWNIFWKWNGPHRIRMFLWLAFKDKLLTNAERRRRHLNASALCTRRDNGNESVLHVLRDCSQAKSLWLRMVPSNSQSNLFFLDLKEWILHNLGNKLDIPCNGN